MTLPQGETAETVRQGLLADGPVARTIHHVPYEQRIGGAFAAVAELIQRHHLERAMGPGTGRGEAKEGADIRLEEYAKVLAEQTLHLGPFADEATTIAHLHDFITAQGRTRRGKHHEIHLSNPRRTAPTRLKTILRQSVG